MRVSRLAELESATRLARRRIDAQREKEGAEPLPPLAELGSSSALDAAVNTEGITAIDARFGEISTLTNRLRGLEDAKSSAAASSFDRTIECVEKDCTWAEAAITALEDAGGARSGQRREHNRRIAATLRARLGDMTKQVQACAVARGKLLQQQQKRRGRFAHSGPAISVNLQLDTPLFAPSKAPPPPPPDLHRTRPNAAERPAAPPPVDAAADPARARPTPVSFGSSRAPMISTFAPPQEGLRARKKQTFEDDEGAGNPRLRMQQQQQQQQTMLEETSRRRLDSAHGIEKEIGKLGELFSRFSSLVAQQAEVVERLDDDVEGAVFEVEAEITKAQKILKGNRSIMIKIFGVMIVLIVLFIAF